MFCFCVVCVQKLSLLTGFTVIMIFVWESVSYVFLLQLLMIIIGHLKWIT